MRGSGSGNSVDHTHVCAGAYTDTHTVLQLLRASLLLIHSSYMLTHQSSPTLTNAASLKHMTLIGSS